MLKKFNNEKFDIDYFKPTLDKFYLQLEWEIKFEGSSDVPSIYSCSVLRKHFISWPQNNQEVSEALELYDFFHEVLHAYLAEKHHVIFSALDFDESLPIDFQDDLIAVLRSANDFYVEHIQQQSFPEVFSIELKSCIKNFIAIGASKGDGTLDTICHFGMIAAQSERYLSETVEACLEGDMIKRIFCKFDPAEPSVDNMVKLVNELFRVFRDVDLELKRFADGKDRWTIAV